MTAANWPAAFGDTERWEGWHQFSDDRYDPSGATWCGLTQRAYDAWRRLKGIATQGVRKATDDELRAIFHDEYWAKVRGDDCPAGIDLLMWDIGVNMGPAVAIRFLQQALNVRVDGVFGLETLGKLQGVNDRAALIQAICARRFSFWHALSTWWRFGNDEALRSHRRDGAARRRRGAPEGQEHNIKMMGESGGAPAGGNDRFAQ